MKINDPILNRWLALIPTKEFLWIHINNELTDVYNKTNKNYIVSFDIEFYKYHHHSSMFQLIREMGGLVIVKHENKWYLYALFHFNIRPLMTDLNKMYLLSSKYATISEPTFKKVKEIEEKMLLHEQLIHKEYLFDEEILRIIKNNKLSKRFLSNNKIEKLMTIKYKSYDKFIKELGRMIHLIYGASLKHIPEYYNMFKSINILIMNDKDVIKRTIKRGNEEEFLLLTNELFNNSYLIIKGMEDIKALRNEAVFLKMNYDDKDYKYFDIAVYNDYFNKKCDSAELEKSFKCLDKMNVINEFKDFEKIVKEFAHFKAHNPLIDAYYTWIVYNVFATNKVKLN